MSGLQFRPQLAGKVNRGEKTQTRRPVKPGEESHRCKPGRTYAVQPGRGKPAICRVMILAVHQERLGDLSLQDAKAEGFSRPADFYAYWEQLYGKQPRMDDKVWVISFRKARDERPRFLRAAPPVHARPSPADDRAEDDHSGDYCHDPRFALAGEPEAVSEHEQAAITKAAREKPRATRREAWQEQRDRIEHAIGELERLDMGRGVYSNLRQLRARLRRLDDMIDRDAA